MEAEEPVETGLDDVSECRDLGETNAIEVVQKEGFPLKVLALGRQTQLLCVTATKPVAVVDNRNLESGLMRRVLTNEEHQREELMSLGHQHSSKDEGFVARDGQLALCDNFGNLAH